VLGREVTIGEGAHVEGSVLLDGASVGARSTIRGAILGRGAAVGEHCHLDSHVVLGEGVKVGSDNVLAAGARIFPGVQLPDGAIKF
jgi:mannose-1-phosphate guanylyltransferase